MMLSALIARAAGSTIPYRLIGMAAACLAIAGAFTYHAVTVSRLESNVAKAQTAHAAALADIARRDTSIAELERTIAGQNAAVDKLQADGQARARRAADAARQALARHPGPVPQDVAALNSWIRQTPGDQR